MKCVTADFNFPLARKRKKEKLPSSRAIRCGKIDQWSGMWSWFDCYEPVFNHV